MSSKAEALSLSPLLVEGKENKELGASRTQPDVSNGHQDAEPSALELIKIAADAMWEEYMKDECCDYVVINTLVESIRNVLAADHPTSKSRQADTEPEDVRGGCGHTDCVNQCDGDFTWETCPNARRAAR